MKKVVIIIISVFTGSNNAIKTKKSGFEQLRIKN